jgi:hypothetical protein
MLFGVWRPPIFQSSNPENNHLIYLYFNPIQTNPFSCQIKKKKKKSGSCPSLKPLLSLCAAFSSSVCQSAYCNNKKEKERVFFIQQFLLV